MASASPAYTTIDRTTAHGTPGLAVCGCRSSGEAVGTRSDSTDPVAFAAEEGTIRGSPGGRALPPSHERPLHEVPTGNGDGEDDRQSDDLGHPGRPTGAVGLERQVHGEVHE